jgi:hypothetical protein
VAVSVGVVVGKGGGNVGDSVLAVMAAGVHAVRIKKSKKNNLERNFIILPEGKEYL